jgi:hypothetical protein
MVLVDAPRWLFRGRRWSHLVSDTSHAELHAFAESVGIPRRAFQGDHYDVPEDYLERLLAAGATLTTTREIVRRLLAAGLRFGPKQRREAALSSEQKADDARESEQTPRPC